MLGSPPRLEAAPNIVVMLSDDGGYADFGFMNQFSGQTTQFKTPNLDALASQSKVFSNAYVSASICSVSRAGLLTGRYTQRFGMDYNVLDVGTPNDGIPVSETLLSERLKQMGYTTGAIGKWHIGSETAQTPVNQGFDYFYGLWGGSRNYFANPADTTDQKIRRGANEVNWSAEASFNGTPTDPTRGRFLTDAFADEASKFISDHANDAQPFFLYVPFTNPHAPYSPAKQQDLDQFASSSLSGNRKNAAALTYGMDRAVGNIMARLSDPDGNGNQSDSILDDTIVVFLNDNGGASGSPAVHDNTPLRDFKGSDWEGGIRVPMLMRVPGVGTGVFNQAVAATDLFPTLIAAAEGSMTTPTDGVNFLPHLTGQNTSPVHDLMFWRGGDSAWAVRKGSWKVVKGNGVVPEFELFQLNANGSGETTNLAASQPAKFQELVRDYVNWEATVDKPRNSAVRAPHRFDVFVNLISEPGASANRNWRFAQGWANAANPAEVFTIARDDSCANTTLVFKTRDDLNYTSTNNISRSSGLSHAVVDASVNADNGNPNPPGLIEFMLNKLELSGQFAGAADRTGTLAGYPLLFVKNLAGDNARLDLSGNRSATRNFTFNVNMDLVLHSDLEIVGNGTASFTIGGGATGGQIRDFFEPRSLTKSGTSSVTLSATNTYTGATTINGGTLRIQNGAQAAALNGTSEVHVGAQGTLALVSGLVRTPLVRLDAGSTFNFTGGALETQAVTGNLIVNGGEMRPGLSLGSAAILGNYTQTAGKLLLEIGGTAGGINYDQLVATGSASLGGSLQIVLANPGSGVYVPQAGATFDVVKSLGTISGEFSSIVAPALTGGKVWTIRYGLNSVQLSVANFLAGDFDDNGVVNYSDYSTWQSSLGANAGGDADADGDTDGSDFLIWQQQLGAKLITSQVAPAAVPEPSAAFLALPALWFYEWALRRARLAAP